MVWNGFSAKLGWNDFATPMLEKQKQKHGIAGRTDIATVPDLIDFDALGRGNASSAKQINRVAPYIDASSGRLSGG